MVLFVSAIAAGLLLGGTMALIALGLVVAFRATRTFNFAHGEFMLLPAYIVGYLQARHDSLVVSIVVAMLLAGVVGSLFYLIVLRRTTGLPLFMGIVATFGLAAILDGIMGIAFAGRQYSIKIGALPKGSVRIAGARISESSLVLTGLTLLIALSVVVVMRFTRVGVLVRAAGQDPILAGQSGIPVGRIYMCSWALAAMLAAVAGISYGSSAAVNTTMIDLGLAAIPAIVLGGLDSIEGAVIGGIALGLTQSFVQVYLGGREVDVITYALLLIGLLLYPQGLFGTKEIVRA
jgi:branched-chain amino acid transport system permease protein